MLFETEVSWFVPASALDVALTILVLHYSNNGLTHGTFRGEQSNRSVVYQPLGHGGEKCSEENNIINVIAEGIFGLPGRFGRTRFSSEFSSVIELAIAFIENFLLPAFKHRQ